MNVYLTAQISEDGSKYQAAVALDDKLLKLELPYKNEQQNAVEALYKTMLKTEDYLKKNPFRGSLLKIGSNNLTFSTDLLSDDCVKTSSIFYKNATLNTCKEELEASLGIKVNADNLINDRIKNTMLQRVYNPEGEQTYHFQQGDLVIARNPEKGATEFDAFAYVTEADKKRNVLYLDKYTKYGEVSWKTQLIPMLKMELEQFYRPMTDDEILEFRDGLTKLLTDPIKSRKLDAPMTTRETYSLVCELADKIEAERKAKTADIEM